MAETFWWNYYRGDYYEEQQILNALQACTTGEIIIEVDQIMVDLKCIVSLPFVMAETYK